MHTKDNPNISRPKSAEARQHLAQVLAASNADVMMLQEVQGDEALNEFLRDELNPELRKQGKPLYEAICLKPRLEDEGYTLQSKYVPMTQAFLYRKGTLDLEKVVVGHNDTLVSPSADEPLFKREVVLGKFNVKLPDGQQQPLWLLNLHFKANGIKVDGTHTFKEFITSTQRLREAYGVQTLLSQELQAYRKAHPHALTPWVVVGGDTNSDRAMTSGASILDALEGKAHRSSHCYYNFETDTLHVPEETVPFQQFRLHSHSLPAEPLTDVIPPDTITCWNEAYGLPFPNRKLDVALVNEATKEHGKASYVPVAKALPQVDATTLRSASDHDPIVMTLDITQSKAPVKHWLA